MVFYFTSRPQEPEIRYSPPRDTTPGPGQYDLERCLSASRSRSPAFTLGARSPPSQRAHRNPGPGDYMPRDVGLRTAPQYSMMPRRDERPATTTTDTPGPGTYGRVSYGAVLPRTPGFQMSSRTPTSKSILAGFEQPSSTPGPGSHDPRDVTKRSAPRYTMAPRISLPRHAETAPGPGTYTRVTNLAALSGHRTGPAFSFAKPTGKR
eukprot:TRINITY_DN18292_c0_g1_i1.p1 TRINITY_DN18292_c0_g1~~TRINITY_DN18292_c0_g1_i1.p1  ORF type:complete len:207 (+),score=14.75 TRINITY_DN18292_c0_g1_i1:110-730(+)